MDREILYVVLPCYNEAENIPQLVKEWDSVKAPLEDMNIELKLIIVNDGSDSETERTVDKLKDENLCVDVIHHKHNMGLGAAVNTGIDHVLTLVDNGMLCVMDADMTHSPEYILPMVKRLRSGSDDCVIASRYRSGSEVQGLSLYRKLLSLGARFLYTLRFRITGSKGLIRDYTCGYRLYNIEMLRQLSQKYNNKIIKEKGFACMVELLVKISKNNFRISEIPFTLKYHLKEGKSKMQVMKTINRSLYLVMKL